MLVLVGVTVMW